MNEPQTKQLFARLEVNTGEFVANVAILPFIEPPDVIVWGSRTFKLWRSSKKFPESPDIYRECFTWYATETVEIPEVEVPPVAPVPIDVPPVDRSNVCTTDGKPLNQSPDDVGQHANYKILCDEERAKGFVRPVRSSYKHVGIRPVYPVRDLTEDEDHYRKFGYIKFEAYPKGSPSIGRYWTQVQLISGCGTVTTMGSALSETWARDPSF